MSNVALAIIIGGVVIGFFLFPYIGKVLAGFIKALDPYSFLKFFKGRRKRYG